MINERVRDTKAQRWGERERERERDVDTEEGLSNRLGFRNKQIKEERQTGIGRNKDKE